MLYLFWYFICKTLGDKVCNYYINDVIKFYDSDYITLLSDKQGPVGKIQAVPTSPTYVSTDSPFLPEINTPENGSGDLKMPPAHLTTDAHVKSPIPLVLSSYLGGKQRTVHGNVPTTANWTVWCLASDMLACCPFRSFLQRNEQHKHLQYLGFWTDIRHYLDTDEQVLDGYGLQVREQLVRR